jgi:hypothetical protein
MRLAAGLPAVLQGAASAKGSGMLTVRQTQAQTAPALAKSSAGIGLPWKAAKAALSLLCGFFVLVLRTGRWAAAMRAGAFPVGQPACPSTSIGLDVDGS